MGSFYTLTKQQGRQLVTHQEIRWAIVEKIERHIDVKTWMIALRESFDYCCVLLLFFQLERMDVSLSDPQAPVVRGTRFPGNSYYQFPSDTLPVNTDFTGTMSRFMKTSVSRRHVCIGLISTSMFVCTYMHTYKPVFLLWCAVIPLQCLSLPVTFL